MNKEQRLKRDGFEGIEPVLFYGCKQSDPWPFFSNFSRQPVILPDPWSGMPRVYETGEHRYQAMKADNEDEHNWVCEANGPGKAKDRGRKVELRESWGEHYATFAYYVMLETVMAKASQFDVVLEALQATEDRPIYEDSPTDDIWGWRFQNSYNGANLLGLCWMQARSFYFQEV